MAGGVRRGDPARQEEVIEKGRKFGQTGTGKQQANDNIPGKIVNRNVKESKKRGRETETNKGGGLGPDGP